jgi:uncharacterized protein
MNFPPAAPLSDAELETLDLFLQRGWGEIGSMEMLDGYFAALLAGPELVMPSRYLPHVLGDADDPDGPAFSTIEEAQGVLDLLMRHWNHMVHTLLAGRTWDLILATEENARLGREWADGFLLGVSLTPAAWRPIIEDDERAGTLIPIMILAHEDHPDPALRSPAITPELRETLLAEISAGLTQLYQDSRPAPAGRRPRRPGNRARARRRRKGGK